MKIDITREPPADIYRDLGKYFRISIALLSLVAFGLLLMVYGMVRGGPRTELLETVSLILFVGPGLLFFYFGGKLKAYKGLVPEQQRELAALGRKHPQVAVYCSLVAKQGRAPIFAEYEACKKWK
ncbi:hypothetical protein ACUUL3_04210 [Thiovibrio sp. JS02]